MTEHQIHDGFIAWLKRLEVPFIHHRMDKKSGIRSGWPDFTVLWMSRVVCIEIKTERGRVTLEQARVMAFIKRSGNKAVICRSVEECIEAVKNILCEGKIGDESLVPEKRPRFAKEFNELKQKVAKVPGNGSGNRMSGKQPSAAFIVDHDVEKPKFAIGNWHGADYVFAPALDGEYSIIRRASAADLINFPKLSGYAPKGRVWGNGELTHGAK